MVRKCKHHGDTIFSQRADGYWSCMKCAASRTTNAQQSLKQRMVDYAGGCCTICGYNGYIGALEFHHIKPSTKSFEINSRTKKTWEAILAEIEKCILLCSNCHKEVHAGITLLTDRRYKVWENCNVTQLGDTDGTTDRHTYPSHRNRNEDKR